MATVRGVVNFRVKPGRYAELFKGIKAVKTVIEKIGAKVIVNRQQVGPEVGNIFVVVAYSDYAEYAKVASHPELSALIDAMRNNPDPAWEGITVTLNEEVEISNSESRPSD
jgi:hypothetical protein